MADWINKRGCIYFYDQYALNEQHTAFAKYDPDRIVAEILDTGADIVAVYASNQYGIAYYPSKIWPQHPGLKGRDYYGEVASRLQARGKKVIAYTNWLDSKHPEWNVVPLGKEREVCTAPQPLADWADPQNPNGRVQALPGGAWNVPCYNSPRREDVLAITREILDLYRPDGFMLDMFFYTGVCVCNYCRPVLENICQTKEITREAIRDHWVDHINWRCERSASFIAEVSRLCRERGVLTVHNAFAPLYQPAIGGVSQDWLDSLDVFVSECFDAFLTPCTDLNSTSINVRWQHAIGKPSWVLRTSTPPHLAHWPISRAQWQLYAAACKANGCKVFGPCGVGARPDTTTSPRQLSRVKEAFELYMLDADLSEDAASAAKIGLVFSWATRKYYSDDLQWAEEFTGWARLLIEEHLPYDIVTAERVRSPNDLAKYDLVILPNVANLSDDSCEAVRQYVSQGGRVLATAETSLRDDRGNLRADFALGDVLAISRKGICEGNLALERPVEAEPISGVFQQIETWGETLSRYVEVDPAGPVAGTKDPLPMQITNWPACVKNHFGQGQTICITFDIGRLYETHGYQHIGIWMAELIDAILPERQLLLKAPRTVEVTVWAQDGRKRMIVHLTNRTVPWTLPTDARQITEIIPVHNIELTMASPGPSPKVTCRGAEIASQIHGDRLKISVSELNVYAAVVVDSETSGEPRRSRS